MGALRNTHPFASDYTALNGQKAAEGRNARRPFSWNDDPTITTVPTGWCEKVRKGI